MKCAALTILLLLAVMPSIGQVMFRNDFILGKHTKSRNKGISFIMISMGRPQGIAPFSGRNGTLIIDVHALRHPDQTSYTYRQLAERTYGMTPGVTMPTQTVPQYLLMEPPHIAPPSIPVVRVRR